MYFGNYANLLYALTVRVSAFFTVNSDSKSDNFSKQETMDN